jgi:hypothetical protein
MITKLRLHTQHNGNRWLFWRSRSSTAPLNYRIRRSVREVPPLLAIDAMVLVHGL